MSDTTERAKALIEQVGYAAAEKYEAVIRDLLSENEAQRKEIEGLNKVVQVRKQRHKEPNHEEYA